LDVGDTESIGNLRSVVKEIFDMITLDDVIDPESRGGLSSSLSKTPISSLCSMTNVADSDVYLLVNKDMEIESSTTNAVIQGINSSTHYLQLMLMIRRLPLLPCCLFPLRQFEKDSLVKAGYQLPAGTVTTNLRRPGELSLAFGLMMRDTRVIDQFHLPFILDILAREGQQRAGSNNNGMNKYARLFEIVAQAHGRGKSWEASRSGDVELILALRQGFKRDQRVIRTEGRFVWRWTGYRSVQTAVQRCFACLPSYLCIQTSFVSNMDRDRGLIYLFYKRKKKRMKEYI
jgi:hypothetical protein